MYKLQIGLAGEVTLMNKFKIYICFFPLRSCKSATKLPGNLVMNDYMCLKLSVWRNHFMRQMACSAALFVQS
jgi:hypothetical protein